MPQHIDQRPAELGHHLQAWGISRCALPATLIHVQASQSGSSDLFPGTQVPLQSVPWPIYDAGSPSTIPPPPISPVLHPGFGVPLEQYILSGSGPAPIVFTAPSAHLLPPRFTHQCPATFLNHPPNAQLPNSTRAGSFPSSRSAKSAFGSTQVNGSTAPPKPSSGLSSAPRPTKQYLTSSDPILNTLPTRFANDLPPQFTHPFQATSTSYLPSAQPLDHMSVDGSVFVPKAISSALTSTQVNERSSAIKPSNGLSSVPKKARFSASNISSISPSSASADSLLIINDIPYKTLDNHPIGLATTNTTRDERKGKFSHIPTPIPLPSRTLVLEAIPKKFRNQTFVDQWLSQFTGMPPVRHVEWRKEKLLIEFANKACKERAFSSRCMAGNEGLRTVRAYHLRLSPEPMLLVQQAAVAEPAPELPLSSCNVHAPFSSPAAPTLHAPPLPLPIVYVLQAPLLSSPTTQALRLKPSFASPLLVSSPGPTVIVERPKSPMLLPALSCKYLSSSSCPSPDMPSAVLEPSFFPHLGVDTCGPLPVVRDASSVEASLRAEVLNTRTKGVKRGGEHTFSRATEPGTDSTSASALLSSLCSSVHPHPASGVDDSARPVKRAKTTSVASVPPASNAARLPATHVMPPRERVEALIAEFNRLHAEQARATVKAAKDVLRKRMAEIDRCVARLLWGESLTELRIGSQ
jgi:hypothetical protein